MEIVVYTRCIAIELACGHVHVPLSATWPGFIIILLEIEHYFVRLCTSFVRFQSKSYKLYTVYFFEFVFRMAKTGRGAGRNASAAASANAEPDGIAGPRRSGNVPRVTVAVAPRQPAPAPEEAPRAAANPAPAANPPPGAQQNPPGPPRAESRASDEDSNDEREPLSSLVTSGYSRRESDHARQGLQLSGEPQLAIDKSGVSTKHI